MPTVGQKIADELVAARGRYPGNPRVVMIIEYDNAWGGRSYGLIYKGQALDRYRETDYVRKPRVYWSAPGVLIPECFQK
jgi:hypothetical protein